MRILFIRHGESEANTQKIFSNRGWKHPLTPLGRLQIESLADELLTDRTILAIYSSPLQRAVESARIFADKLHIPKIEIDPALIEYDVGIYEDRPHYEGAADYTAVEDRWAASDPHAKIPGGESTHEICHRFQPLIHRLIQKHGNEKNTTILLIGHGGTFRQALPAILPNISPSYARQHALTNAASVEAELINGHLHCTRWSNHTLIGNPPSIDNLSR